MVTEKQRECGRKYAELNFDREAKRKKVLQYDLQGNFIKEWNSVVEARKGLNIWHIASCCRKERKTAGGFIWKYKDTQ